MDPSLDLVISQSHAYQQLVDQLRQMGATTPARAKPLPNRPDPQGALKQMLASGVIGEAAPGQFYLDEEELERQRDRASTQGRRVGMILGAAAVVVVITLLVLTFVKGAP